VPYRIFQWHNVPNQRIIAAKYYWAGQSTPASPVLVADRAAGDYISLLIVDDNGSRG
jgi:nitrous oxide reductase accessory protein NosL